jgi:hypothetical protein
MTACQERIQELESSLKSFIDSSSERMMKTEEKLETICNRIDRLESLNSDDRREFTEMEITTDSVDENEVSQEQKVNLSADLLLLKFEI